MKAIKKVLAFVLAAVMTVSLVGCGEISYDDITGDWTTKSINGTSVAEYAESLGTTVEMAATNMQITEDDKLVATNAAASANYVYERKSNGIEVKEEGKDEILFSMVYDSDAKTFSYQMDLGEGQMLTIVMEKGKIDFPASGKDKKSAK